MWKFSNLDRPVETATALKHNKPDVILIDKKKKFWTIIDFSVPNDKRVITKENEKIENYSKLAGQIREVHHVKTTIVPLVVGALGVVSKNLKPNLERLGIPHVFRCMQMSAVLGTAVILKKVLNL